MGLTGVRSWCGKNTESRKVGSMERCQAVVLYANLCENVCQGVDRGSATFRLSVRCASCMPSARSAVLSVEQSRVVGVRAMPTGQNMPQKWHTLNDSRGFSGVTVEVALPVPVAILRWRPKNEGDRT